MLLATLVAASPKKMPDSPPAASGRGLSQSQNSLLVRLEREANQVMEGLGGGAGLAMRDLEGRFDTHTEIDPKILSEVRGTAVQGVLVTNSDGLDDMFRHYSRNQHTGAQSKRKRGGAYTVDSSGIRIMDEHGWIRCCKEMGMSKSLSTSKLLACFRSCSYTSENEVKAVCDENGFCSSIACVAVVSRMGVGGVEKNDETAREMVAQLLSEIDLGETMRMTTARSERRQRGTKRRAGNTTITGKELGIRQLRATSWAYDNYGRNEAPRGASKVEIALSMISLLRSLKYTTITRSSH